MSLRRVRSEPGKVVVGVGPRSWKREAGVGIVAKGNAESWARIGHGSVTNGDVVVDHDVPRMTSRCLLRAGDSPEVLCPGLTSLAGLPVEAFAELNAGSCSQTRGIRP